MRRMVVAVAALALAACGGGESDVFGGDAQATSESGTGGAAGSGAGGAAATGGAGGTALPLACVPGKQEACACPGGAKGAQACRADGSGYDACACPDGGAGGASGSTSSSGETTTSSASATGGVWCVIGYGCTGSPTNVMCEYEATLGYPMSAEGCDTMPPCCIKGPKSGGMQYYCCPPK